MKKTYTVTAPATPGATPTVTIVANLRHADRLAFDYRHRRDLRAQDVRIDIDGRLVRYAGPNR